MNSYPRIRMEKCSDCPTEFEQKPHTKRKRCDPCIVEAARVSKQLARAARAKAKAEGVAK